jgi:hypothetical protein
VGESSADPQAGAARVLALLGATLAALRPLAAGEDGEGARTAREAVAGLVRVRDWLEAAAPGARPPVSAAPAEPAADGDARLAAVLRAAIDDLAALSEALEHDDPVTHFDAVQASGLAAAVLGAAYLRLLRAGLARPRPVNLLAP